MAGLKFNDLGLRVDDDDGFDVSFASFIILFFQSFNF